MLLLSGVSMVSSEIGLLAITFTHLGTFETVGLVLGTLVYYLRAQGVKVSHPPVFAQNVRTMLHTCSGQKSCRTVKEALTMRGFSVKKLCS